MTLTKKLFIGIIIGLIWYLIFPRFYNNRLSEATTRVQIQRLKSQVNGFFKSQKRVPNDLGELRLFVIEQAAKFNKSVSFSPYDGLGQRFEYYAISPKNYLLRSSNASDGPFGGLIVANLPKLQTLPELPPIAPTLDPSTYPAFLLPGMSKFGLYGEIIRHPDLNKKTLIVRKHLEKRYAAICPHTGVEEFFILSTTRIIFTATGSKTYEDGIYLWDLESNHTQNLLNSAKMFAQVGHQSNKYFLSLSSVWDQKVIAYITKSPAPITLATFYDSSKRYELVFDANWNFLNIQSSSSNRTKTNHFPLTPNRTIEGMTTQGLKTLQQSWLQLPIKGPVGDIIERWQSWTIAHDQSVLFPYSLFWLGFLYIDGYRTLKESHPDVARRLKNYGLEIKSSMASLSAAPSYLQEISFHTSRDFKEFGTLPPPISHLSIPEGSP